MQIFKNTNFDFLHYKWPFIGASLVLSVAGLSSILLHGGLRYGIDFREGTQMTVKWNGAPPENKIRAALSNQISGEVSVQPIEITREVISPLPRARRAPVPLVGDPVRRQSRR